MSYIDMDAYQVVSWLPLTILGIPLPIKDPRTRQVRGPDVAVTRVYVETGTHTPYGGYTWFEAQRMAKELQDDGHITSIKPFDSRIRMCP